MTLSTIIVIIIIIIITTYKYIIQDYNDLMYDIFRNTRNVLTYFSFDNLSFL